MMVQGNLTGIALSLQISHTLQPLERSKDGSIQLVPMHIAVTINNHLKIEQKEDSKKAQ